MFSDILLTVDFDRTLTGPDSKIPQRNLDAIAFFMENGGKFTVNTGRSVATFHKYLDKVPVNAPVLMYNGSARWEDGKLTQLKTIDLPMWETLKIVKDEFPNMNLEVQGTEYHHLVDVEPAYAAFYDVLGWRSKPAQIGEDLGPFLKFALYGPLRDVTVASTYDATPEEMDLMNRAEQLLKDTDAHVKQYKETHEGWL